ncbi:MAG: hypothetical protein ACSHYA_17120 [Opitutaceae bacterium]
MSIDRVINISLREFQQVIKNNSEFQWSPNSGTPPQVGRINLIEYKKKKHAYDLSSPILRSWTVSTDSIEELSRAEELPIPEYKKDGMFYDILLGWFSILPDGSAVEIEWQTGPRFGRGFVYPIETAHSETPYLGKPKGTWIS